jgi:hypothetical protein
MHAKGSPLFYLIAGFIVISVAVHEILTGRAWVRSNGWVYRANEPKTFWWNVAILLLIGLFLVGYCLSLVSGS